MAKPARGPNPRELAMREEVFRVYRDMGPTRSYPRLRQAVIPKFGEINVRTFSAWSKAHSWQSRLVEYDEKLKQSAQLPISVGQIKLDPDFDKVESLLTAAHLALTRALSSVPVVTKPQDFKALVDAANNAIKLAEMLQTQHGKGGARSAEEGRKSMFELLNKLEDRIRKAGAPKVADEVIDVEPVETGAVPVGQVEGDEAPVGSDRVAEAPATDHGEDRDEAGGAAGLDARRSADEHGEAARPMTIAERLAARRKAA